MQEASALEGHTRGHRACPACERSRDKAMVSITANLPFARAVELWIESKRIAAPSGRSRYVSERTLWDYSQYARALNKFFGELTLEDIHAGHIREYHRLRSLGGAASSEDGPRWDKPAGPNKINQEVGLLVRVKKHAGAWTAELEKLYQPLQHEETDTQRAMSVDEQDLWLSTAAGNDRWHLVWWYSLLGLHTTASTNELRGLQLGDINLFSRVIMIRSRSGKNKYRIRTIPLSDQAHWAIERLMERARALGASLPQHYLFPFRVAPNVFDVTRGMTESGIKKLWDEVRKKSGITWLRQYDLRHCGLTRLAEAGVPIQVVMSMAGHISRRMQDHYTHISDQSKRIAVETAFGGRKEPGGYLKRYRESKPAAG